MSDNINYLDIVKQAQLGEQDSIFRLAKDARERVFVYIYRVTLDYHLSEDLSQETMLEMLKSLKRLKVESEVLFWSWLYRTSLGKIQHHFRHQGNRKIEQRTIFDEDQLLERITKDRQNGLEELLQKELSQAVLKAMGQMKVTYRNVLTLRCFNQMSYAEIAAITGGTEIQTRLLFFRARQLIKKQLAQDGFKKEHLLSAMGLFGAITASTTKSASAATVLSPTATKVGVTTVIVGTATSKSGIVAAIVVIAALTMVGTINIFKNGTGIFSGSNKILLSDLVKTKAFELPSSLIRVYDPDGNEWKAANFLGQPRQPAVLVPPERLLVGPRKSPELVVILPEGHWLELGFSGEIVDGPGVDVCVDGGATGATPLLFITDGAGREIQITSPPIYQNTGRGYRLTGFDISGISLSFKPRALRFVGTDNRGPWGGAEIWAVWARVSR